MLTNKKETYHLEEDAANTALQNILSACDKKPNTIPFEKLPHHYKQSMRLPIVMLILTGILFLLTLFFPLYIRPMVHDTEPVITEDHNDDSAMIPFPYSDRPKHRYVLCDILSDQ